MMQSVHFVSGFVKTRFDECGRYTLEFKNVIIIYIYIQKKKMNGRPFPQYDLLYYYICSMQSVHLTRFDA
jgi:hypothetical protein